MAMSRLSSPVEKAEQAKILSALRQEVQAAFDEFELAVAGEPAHSRIEDLRNAFDRLLSILANWQ
jgi:hypothetical protein